MKACASCSTASSAARSIRPPPPRSCSGGTDASAARGGLLHAYLLQEGTWEASGTYLDEWGHETTCWGRNTIEHGKTWTIDAFLTMQGSETETLRSHHHVTPLRGDAASTEYSSESSDLGTVRGRYSFVGDTILGVGRSVQGDLLIVEALRRADIDRYESRGKLLSEGRLLSAWSLTLTRNPT